MKNFKTKIRTLLTALILATLCSSLFITDVSYAKPAAPAEKVCVPDSPTGCPGNPSDYINPDVAKASQEAKAKPATEAAAAEKAAQEAKTAEEKAKEEDCQYKYGTSCAQNKLDENPNSLVEGTFSVTDNLKLDNGEQPKKYFNDNTGESPIVSFILTVINFATTIMGSFAVILFIVAGFMFMVSGGNSQKLDEAKDVVKYAAIGLLVAFMAYVITIFVQSIFSNG